MVTCISGHLVTCARNEPKLFIAKVMGDRLKDVFPQSGNPIGELIGASRSPHRDTAKCGAKLRSWTNQSWLSSLVIYIRMIQTCAFAMDSYLES
jgi:hypothetical protein